VRDPLTFPKNFGPFGRGLFSPVLLRYSLKFQEGCHRGLRRGSSPNNHAMAGCQRKGAGSGGRLRIKSEQQRNGAWAFRSGSGEGANFAAVSIGIANIGAKLDQGHAACRVAGEKVHFVTIASTDVVYLAAATFQFKQNHGFEAWPRLARPEP
jgi:hypothetical protein